MRLRSRDGELTLTAKSAGGEVRDEEEIELERDGFDRSGGSPRAAGWASGAT